MGFALLSKLRQHGSLWCCLYPSPVVAEGPGACGSGEKCEASGSGGDDGSSSQGRRREVRVDHYFDATNENARIYLLHDMVTPHECEALKDRARPRLAAAAVTGDSPGEKIGEWRAWAAWSLPAFFYEQHASHGLEPPLTDASPPVSPLTSPNNHPP